MLGSTFGTYSFYDVVDFPGDESFGQGDMGYQVFAQTVGVLTHFAIKVTMSFVFVAMAVVVADAVFVRAASVVYAMYQVVFVEKYEGTENDGLVDAVKLFFQRAQAERIGGFGNGLIDEQPGGSGADTGCFQDYGIIFGFHKKWMLILLIRCKDKHPLGQPGCF